jgi:hypothetical protein
MGKTDRDAIHRKRCDGALEIRAEFCENNDQGNARNGLGVRLQVLFQGARAANARCRPPRNRTGPLRNAALNETDPKLSDPQVRLGPPEPRTPWLGLLTVLGLGFVVRLAVLDGAENIAKDGTVYLAMARQLGELPADRVLPNYHYHPAYPAVVGAIARWTGADWPDGWVRVGQWVSLGMGLLALVGLYFLARSVFGAGPALLTFALMSLSSRFVALGADVSSDAMAGALAVVAVALGFGASRLIKAGSTWAVAVAGGTGFVAGAGYLTRPEELLSAIVAIVPILLIGKLTRRQRKVQLASAGVLIAATLACVLPYAMVIGGLTQKKSLSDFLPTGDGVLPAAAVHAPAGILSSLRRVLDRGREAIGTGPTVLCIVCWATWFGRGILRLPLPKGVVIKPSPVGAIVLFLPLAVMIPMLVALAMVHEPEYLSSRHMLMPTLILSPCAGAGLAILVHWTLLLLGYLHRYLLRRAGEGAPSAGTHPLIWVTKHRPGLWSGLWLLGAMIPMMVVATPVLHEGKACYRQAGQYVRAQFGSGRYFLSTTTWVPFFAAAPPEQFTLAPAMPMWLDPARLRDAKADLRHGPSGAAGATYEFLALGADFLQDPNNAGLADRVMTDPRLELVWPVAEAADRPGSSVHKERVWVFRLR